MQHPRVEGHGHPPTVEAPSRHAHIPRRPWPRLRARYPALRFVWLMGADNLAQFHLWARTGQADHRNGALGVVLCRTRPADLGRMSRGDAVWPYRIAGAAQPALGGAIASAAWCFVNVRWSSQFKARSALRAQMGQRSLQKRRPPVDRVPALPKAKGTSAQIAGPTPSSIGRKSPAGFSTGPST